MQEVIRVYARLKPAVTSDSVSYDISELTSYEADRYLLQFGPFRTSVNGSTTQVTESLLQRFQFERVFDPASEQLTIFQTIARPIIDKVIDGFNGTLFAYGQTGSGKTYTISGCSLDPSDCDAGIIPRTLRYLFEHEPEPNIERTIAISCLEIYNEVGYDLLQYRDVSPDSDDQSRIQLLEDADQNIHIRNLAVREVTSLSEALELFSLSERNRARSETPLNPASTRSHCIFTIIVKTGQADSAVTKIGKMHIVDLAGSERVYKSAISGRTLAEAKNINLGLHHLEQVISALAEKERIHVPYRNSLMTMILKDSLGGNSLTSMIATCSLDEANLGETLSTCRFAQRAGLVKNDVFKNESVDPLRQTELLKKELAEVKASYELLAGQSIESGPLRENDLRHCDELLRKFLDEDSQLEATGLDWRKIKYMFGKLRADSGRSRAPVDSSTTYSLEVERLQDTIKQKSEDIEALGKLYKAERKKCEKLQKKLDSVAVTPKPEYAQPAPTNIHEQVTQSRPPSSSNQQPAEKRLTYPSNVETPSRLSNGLESSVSPPSNGQAVKSIELIDRPTPTLTDAEALRMFVDNHPSRQQIEHLKQRMRKSMTELRHLESEMPKITEAIETGETTLAAVRERIGRKMALCILVDEDKQHEATFESRLSVLKATRKTTEENITRIMGEISMDQKDLLRLTREIQDQFGQYRVDNMRKSSR